MYLWNICCSNLRDTGGLLPITDCVSKTNRKLTYSGQMLNELIDVLHTHSHSTLLDIVLGKGTSKFDAQYCL